MDRIHIAEQVTAGLIVLAVAAAAPKAWSLAKLIWPWSGVIAFQYACHVAMYLSSPPTLKALFVLANITAFFFVMSGLLEILWPAVRQWKLSTRCKGQ